MQSKVLSKNEDVRLIAAVLSAGEEAFSSVENFVVREGIRAASVTAIGAFSRATLGWFDIAAKGYRRIPVDEQCEVLSVIGDIGRDDNGEVSLHLHAVLGLADGSTRGGHLLEGFVNPTLELMITETPAYLHRRKRPDLGIALLDLSSS